MKRWNERRSYTSNSSHNAWAWQGHFLEAVRLECPEVLQQLRSQVLPAYQEAAERLAKSEDPKIRRLGWNLQGQPEWTPARCFELIHALGGRPECSEALKALGSWASTFKIDVPFVRAVASKTLKAWHTTPPLDGAPLNWIGLELAEYRRSLDETPLRSWDPMKEPLREFRKRIGDHIEAGKAVARERRWVPRGKETDFEEYHFRWLALSQVRQEGAKEISNLGDTRPELRPPHAIPTRAKGVSKRTIEDAVKVIGKALDLPRRGRGRPRKKMTSTSP